MGLLVQRGCVCGCCLLWVGHEVIVACSPCHNFTNLDVVAVIQTMVSIFHLLHLFCLNQPCLSPSMSVSGSVVDCLMGTNCITPLVSVKLICSPSVLSWYAQEQLFLFRRSNTCCVWSNQTWWHTDWHIHMWDGTLSTSSLFWSQMNSWVSWLVDWVRFLQHWLKQGTSARLMRAVVFILQFG